MFRKKIGELFQEEELQFIGIVPLEVRNDFEKFQSWLSEKKHGSMTYLENHSFLRENPQKLLAGANSAFIFGLFYFQKENILDKPKVALYARFKDYHVEMRTRAEKIVSQLKKENPNNEYRIAVDSAPLLERALAKNSELGFIGKNTCFIHPKMGSFLLLGEILTTQILDYDSPKEIPLEKKVKEGGCGPCDLCQVNCPTNALDENYKIDATKCLSYWTIEHRGAIPEKFWPHLAKYYFGCDICQLVCPYNKTAEKYLLPKSIIPKNYPDLFTIATMDQKTYEKYFGGTPLTRAKREGLIRNALIAMLMTSDKKLREAITLLQNEKHSTIQETISQINRLSLLRR